jgi:hypothetical protein
MMHSTLHALLASFNGPPVMYIMMLPISIFVIMGIIAVVGMAMKNQERERWHETARLAIEKGVPVPSMPLAAPPVNVPLSRHKQRMGLITGGLVNIGVGIGVYFGLSAIQGASETRFWGLIPALIGVALILGALIDILLSRKFPDPGDVLPKS